MKEGCGRDIKVPFDSEHPEKGGDVVKCCKTWLCSECSKENFFEIDHCEDNRTVELYIKDCEGKHIQQVSYSTYHKSLTQVCFGCKKIRTSIKREELEGAEKEAKKNE